MEAQQYSGPRAVRQCQMMHEGKATLLGKSERPDRRLGGFLLSLYTSTHTLHLRDQVVFGLVPCSLQTSGRQRQDKAETGGESYECGQIREPLSVSDELNGKMVGGQQLSPGEGGGKSKSAQGPIRRRGQRAA